MTRGWTATELGVFDQADELEVATYRPDGTLRSFVPIWVVVAAGEVAVRTWHRRTTGWFGHAVHAGRVRVRVPGLETDALVDDVGLSTPQRRAAVDAAYRATYGRYGTETVARMVGDDAAAATLLLRPVVGDRSPA